MVSSPLWANPYHQVSSAFDEGDAYDVNVSVDYRLELHRASIRREQSGLPGTDPNAATPVVKDLYFRGSKHIIEPRVEVGVYTDLALSLALPLVLYQGSSLDFDQRGGSCVFPGEGPSPTCVNRDNSSTVLDGLLPADGFDADNPSGPGFNDGAKIFRGPSRAGLDQVHLGLVWAAMNQARDDTKPVWKLGAEFALAVGSAMKLNRADPDSETSVGRGLHELKLWTSFAREMRLLTPYVELWWQTQIATTDDSAFQSVGFGQERSSAQQKGGVRIGFEAVVYDKSAGAAAGATTAIEDAGGQSFIKTLIPKWAAVDGGIRMDAYFEGRAYTEMWEVFQYAGALDSGGPLVLDADPVTDGVQALAHPGVSYVENHLRFGGNITARTKIGPAWLGMTFETMYTQPHMITFEDAGVDLPTCAPGAAEIGCESDDNNLVNPNTVEVDPLHVPLIDQVGRRYRVDESFDYVLRIEARVTF